jgi:hypothetical protein
VIPAIAPIVETVGASEILHLRVQRICPIEGGALPGMERVGLPVAS